MLSYFSSEIMQVGLLVYSMTHAVCLVAAQIFLKFGLTKFAPFGWNWTFWKSFLINWQFALCGLLFGGASLLWFYILKHFPFSQAYPLISLSYVFGLIASVFIFHENVSWTAWAGVGCIMLGCFLVTQ